MSVTKLVGVSVLPRLLESHIWAQLTWLMCTNSLALEAVLEESIGKKTCFVKLLSMLFGLMTMPIMNRWARLLLLMCTNSIALGAVLEARRNN